MHRSSMFGSSPRAPLQPTRHTLSRSESIKKKSGAAKWSKRARMRTGLAAALQEFRLAGRKHRARGLGAGGASEALVSVGATHGGGYCTPGAAAPLHVSAGAAEVQESRVGVVAGGGGRRGWPPSLLVVAVLALACVVVLGRAPTVCYCTCVAWLCRWPRTLCGSAAASTGGRHRSSEPSAAATDACELDTCANC